MATSIVAALAFVCGVLSASNVDNLRLPPPTGVYSVGSKAYALTHTTLNETVAAGNTSSSLLLNIYYPTRNYAPSQRYIWPELAALFENYFSLPLGALGNMTANIAFDAAPLSASEYGEIGFPTLLFGPACGGPPSRMFFGVISELVSRGFAVVSVDHPVEQPYIQYPDGSGVYGEHAVDWSPDDADIERIHAYRLVDNSAVLDALPAIASQVQVPLNLTHFAFFGHSLGGSAALGQVIYERNRTSSADKTLMGALNLDGTVFGPAAENSSMVDLHIPSLLIASSIHPPIFDPSWPQFESVQTAWNKGLRIEGRSNHTDFYDSIFYKQAYGIGGGEGAIKAERFLNVSRTFVGAFFELLLGKGEGVLSGSEEVGDMWPEVVFDKNETTPA